MDRQAALTVAFVLVVVLAGCSDGTSPAPESDSPGPGPGPETTTPESDSERPSSGQSDILQWSILRTVGTDLENGSVGQLTTVLSYPAVSASLDEANTTLLLEHEDESYRIVHESATDGEAAGTFSLGNPALKTELRHQRPDTLRTLVVDFSGRHNGSVPVELTAGDTASVLVRTPNGTTSAAIARVPASFDGEAGIVLSGEYQTEDNAEEGGVPAQPVVVSATADRVTSAGAGVLNVTVAKPPGTAPVDYRNVTVRLTGPNSSARLVHPDRRTRADGHVGVTGVRDTDGSVPILNDGDRVKLTLDLGPDSVDVDDGPAGTSVGERLPRSFGTRLYVSVGGRSRRLDVGLPPNASSGPVAVRGVTTRDDGTQTTLPPATTVLASEAQRTGDGALGGLTVNLRKQPTADPIDPRRLSVTVSTDEESYTLVHRSQTDRSADGHFGVEPVFNPDGSAPVLDDYFDLARLTIDLGPDTRPGDDGPLGESVGETVDPGTLVTVRVTTGTGATATRQYYVD